MSGEASVAEFEDTAQRLRAQKHRDDWGCFLTDADPKEESGVAVAWMTPKLGAARLAPDA